MRPRARVSHEIVFGTKLEIEGEIPIVAVAAIGILLAESVHRGAACMRTRPVYPHATQPSHNIVALAA